MQRGKSRSESLHLMRSFLHQYAITTNCAQMQNSYTEKSARYVARKVTVGQQTIILRNDSE